MARIAVVGGGVAGLAAAWEAQRSGHDVVVLEAGARPGGKLVRSPVPGIDFEIDEGADAFLARVPDALELCEELGIDDLVHPASGDARVYAGGRLCPLPKGQLLGLPTDLDEVARSGLVSDRGIERARRDLDATHPPVTDDLSVGALVRGRVGDEVCDHLVEPLLGGINGGEADGLSTEAAAAQLWACARAGGSLIRAAAAMKARAVPGAPVFAAPRGGMAEIPRTLVDRLRAEIRTDVAVESVDPTPGGVAVDGESFDGAVLAIPADQAGRLVRRAAPGAADTLQATDFASVAMVTIAADRDAVDHDLDGSGLVVARTEGLAITAASWGSSKWAHWDDGRHAVFRVSLGHDGDPRDWCSRSDAALVDTALADLSTVLGTAVAAVGARVGRWPRSFPQYRPGHLARLAAIRDELHAAGPIRLAGMSHDGIGVPASIRSGRLAVRSLAS